MKETFWRPLLPLIIIFIVLNGFFIGGRSILEKWKADQTLLIGGNLVIFSVCLISYYLSWRALRSNNPQATVRAMYGSFMIKLFICVLAAVLYIFSVKQNVNKPALFACMGLYLVYTFIEVSILTKLTKRKNA
jgi:hypothetical protein